MRRIALLLLIILLAVGIAPTAYAADDIKDIDAFSSIEGIDKINNYYLDIADMGILNSHVVLLNSMANILLYFIARAVKLACAVYYYTTSVNLAYIFDSQISDIQVSIKNNFFNAIVPLAIGLMGFSIAGYMIKRNFQGVISEFVKFFVIFASVGILATHSITIIQLIDGLTTTASSTVMNAVSGQNSGDSYSVATTKELWRSLIHEPWKLLEFGDHTPDQKVIDNLLSDSYRPYSEERQNYIEGINKSEAGDPKPFNNGMPTYRIGFLIVHILFALIQCLIYIAYGMLIFTFRFMTVFLMIMGILFMVVSLFPTSKGYLLIKKWARRIVDLQINILVINFTVSFMHIVNNMLYQMTDTWGFLVVEVIQAIFALMVFLFRDQITNIFTTASGSAGSQVKRATSQIHHALSNAAVPGGSMHYRNIIAGAAGEKSSGAASASYKSNTNASTSAQNLGNVTSGTKPKPESNKSAEKEQTARPVLVSNNEQVPASEPVNNEVTDTLRSQDATRRTEPETDTSTDTERPALVNDLHRDNMELEENSIKNIPNIGNITTHGQTASTMSERPQLDGGHTQSDRPQTSLKSLPDKKAKQASTGKEKAVKKRDSNLTHNNTKKAIERQIDPANSGDASNIHFANDTRREITKTRQKSKRQGTVLVD